VVPEPESQVSFSALYVAYYGIFVIGNAPSDAPKTTKLQVHFASASPIYGQQKTRRSGNFPSPLREGLI
jgi:hypothetical protein